MGRDPARGPTADTCDFNRKAIFGSTKANAIFQSPSYTPIPSSNMNPEIIIFIIVLLLLGDKEINLFFL